jgi:hypothetical protein
MNGLKLATPDTPQYRLARDAESADSLTHRQKSFASFTVESPAPAKAIGRWRSARSLSKPNAASTSPHSAISSALTKAERVGIPREKIRFFCGFLLLCGRNRLLARRCPRRQCVLPARQCMI